MKNLLDKLGTLPQFIDGSSSGSMWRLAASQSPGEDNTTIFVKLADVESLIQSEVIAILHVKEESPAEPYYLPLGRGSVELAKLVKSNGWNLAINSDGMFAEYLRGDSEIIQEYLLKADDSAAPEGFVSLGKGSDALADFAKARGWNLFAYVGNGKLVGAWWGNDAAIAYFVKKV